MFSDLPSWVMEKAIEGRFMRQVDMKHSSYWFFTQVGSSLFCRAC